MAGLGVWLSRESAHMKPSPTLDKHGAGGGICNVSTWGIKREGKTLKNILIYIVNLRSAWAT